MKIAVAILALASLSAITAQSYSGQTFVFGADIAARSSGDIQNVNGYTRFRTLNANQLFFESALNNAAQITGVHLHLSTPKGAVDGGPLVIALTNTTSPALSASGNSPLIQIGNVTNTQLLANPQLANARAAIVALGITDNLLQNIGDVDRLARAGLLYSDCHSVTRVSPNRVGSGAVALLPASTGRKML